MYSGSVFVRRGIIIALLISRSKIDSKSGVNKKGTERLHFWSNFNSLSRVVFTLQGVKTTPFKKLKLLQKCSKKRSKIYSKKGVVLYLFYLLHFWNQFDSFGDKMTPIYWSKEKSLTNLRNQ